VKVNLAPWMVAVSGTIAVVLPVATGVGYGWLQVMACAGCLGAGWILGAVVAYDARKTSHAEKVAELGRRITEQADTLIAVKAQNTALRLESAKRLEQGGNAAALAASNLAALKAFRAEAAGG
jgi:hypothetical protein